MAMKYNFEKIGADTLARIEKGILPGALIAVNIGGERVYEFCGGYSNVAERKPLERDAIFRLASMTKPITAAACLIQQDRGQLSVKDPVSKYLPEFKRMYVGILGESGEVTNRPADREITIEDILTHSSGLGSGPIGDRQFSEFAQREGMGLAETVSGYSRMLLDFSPGTSQLYSPALALDIVVRIVELTSGLSYEEFLKRNLFEPLGMENTTYRLDEEQRKRLVPMYRLSDDVTNIDTIEDFGESGFQNFPVGYPGGAAGLFGCFEDYSRFVEMLCAEGACESGRVLSREAVRMMRKPHFEVGFAGVNSYFNWGYAVRVVSEQTAGVQELTPGSFGWSGAYNTHFWVDPKRKLTGIYMSNLDNAGGAGAVTAWEFECNTMRAISNKR